MSEQPEKNKKQKSYRVRFPKIEQRVNDEVHTR